MLQDIQEKQNEFKLDPDTYNYYQDKIRKMVFAQTLEQKQREKSFQIISKPEINDSPIWPNHIAIISTMLFLGFIFLKIGSLSVFTTNSLYLDCARPKKELVKQNI